MARKTKDVIIEREGRDKGKRFRLTEMSPFQAEKWAFRVLQALAANAVEVPPDIASVPMARLASLGLQALARVPFEVAEPLFDEMIGCINVLPPNGQPRELLTDAGVEDIEEVHTILELRKEVFMLHVDFFTEGSTLTTG